MSKKIKDVPFMDYQRKINALDKKQLVYAEDFYEEMEEKAKRNLRYCNIYNQLCNIALKMYKWTVDSNIDPKVIERGLLERGLICAYDGALGKFILPGGMTGYKNVYGNATQVRVYGYNGWQDVVNILQDFESPQPDGQNGMMEKTMNKGVYMIDNYMEYPYINYIKDYADDLTDISLALNVATQRLKCPFHYVVKNKALLGDIAKLQKKLKRNDDVIIEVKESLSDDITKNIQLVENKMNPAIAQHIREVHEYKFNKFLELIGLNTNPSPDKTQYTNLSDSNSNNSLIDIESDVRFDNRKKFCEDCKKLGINISVEKNIDEAMAEANKFNQEMLNEGGQENDKSDKQ